MPLLAVAYVGLLIVGMLTAFGLVWRSLKERTVPGARMFAASLGAVVLWSLAALLAFLAQDVAHKLFWMDVSYFGITLVPLSWFLFVLRYTGHGSWLNRRLLLLLCVHPVATLFLVWTNPQHHWFRQHLIVVDSDPMLVLDSQMGPAFWAHTVYSYLLLSAAAYLLISTHVQAFRAYRRQTTALLIAVLAPWVANVVTLFGADSLMHLDITPLAFVVSGLAVTFGLFHRQFLDLVPIAHDVVFRELETGVIVLDRQDHIVEMNAAARSILGANIENAIGEALREVMPQYGYLVSRCRNMESVQEEITIGNGGDNRVYDFQLAPLHDRRQQIVGRLVTLRDVSRRKKAELILSRHAERLRVLHEIDRAIQTALSVESVAHIVLDHCQRLFPLDRALVFFLGTTSPGFSRVLASYGSDVEPIVADDAILSQLGGLVKDGTLRYFEDLTDREASIPKPVRLFCTARTRSFLLVPLTVQRRLIGLLTLECGVSRAYTPWMIDTVSQIATSLAVALENARLYEAAQRELVERRQLEQALRQSERAAHQRAEELEVRNAELDAFAHTVAHDLKAPLSLLLGYTSFIEAGEVAGDAAQLRTCVQAIGESARKMGNIVDELLLLASVRRVEEVELQPLDMGAIVHSALVRLSDVTEQRGVEIVLPSSWPIPWGYTPWVEEIWVNYISNAIKYGGTPPRIEMGGGIVNGENGPMARFWIHDNGDGLSLEEQRRLFVPFERLKRSRIQGHGLGLSIVRRIVERLGGEAGVESSAIPGEGCTFYFTLPLADLGA